VILLFAVTIAVIIMVSGLLLYFRYFSRKYIAIASTVQFFHRTFQKNGSVIVPLHSVDSFIVYTYTIGSEYLWREMERKLETFFFLLFRSPRWGRKKKSNLYKLGIFLKIIIDVFPRERFLYISTHSLYRASAFGNASLACTWTIKSRGDGALELYSTYLHAVFSMIRLWFICAGYRARRSSSQYTREYTVNAHTHCIAQKLRYNLACIDAVTPPQ